MDNESGNPAKMIVLLLVQAVSEYIRLNRRAPVTAALISANTLVYLRPEFLRRLIPPFDAVSLNPQRIIEDRDIKSFFLAPFYHVGEHHIIYSMLSLVSKGSQLELQMGSIEFLSLVGILLLMSQGFTLLLARSLLMFEYERAFYNRNSYVQAFILSYQNQQIVGFCSILTAMRIILDARANPARNVMKRFVYATLAEMVMAQILVPHLSFVAHLGGLVTGLWYIWTTPEDGTNPFVVKVLSIVVRVMIWMGRLLGRSVLRAMIWVGRSLRSVLRAMIWVCSLLRSWLRMIRTRTRTCPTCGFINAITKIPFRPFRPFRYCRQCGQKL